MKNKMKNKNAKEKEKEKAFTLVLLQLLSMYPIEFGVDLDLACAVVSIFPHKVVAQQRSGVACSIQKFEVQEYLVLVLVGSQISYE